MTLPLHITFRGFSSSEALEAKIRSRVEKLEQMFSSITSCRVVIEAPHHHQQKGNSFRVSIDLTIPHGELIARSSDGPAHQDVYIAVRDAFDALGRQLRSRVSRGRDAGKRREPARAAAD